MASAGGTLEADSAGATTARVAATMPTLRPPTAVAGRNSMIRTGTEMTVVYRSVIQKASPSPAATPRTAPTIPGTAPKAR